MQNASVEFDFIQRIESMWSIHVGYMKTNYVHVTQFNHLEPMYTSELSKFNDCFFFFFSLCEPGSAKQKRKDPNSLY